MSTFEKRAREDKRAEKARIKEQRRNEKRSMAPAAPEVISAAEVIGNVRSIEEVLREISGGGSQVSRSAPAIPSKLFVGSLSDSTTSASLRAHFEAHCTVAEAVVITDRGTGQTRNFGFVTAADRKDAAGVISALHHSELDGNRIVVNIATENR